MKTSFAHVTLLATAAAVCISSSARAQCGEWSAGFHMPGIDGQVNAIAQFDDGSGPALIVGGQFGFAGGEEITGIAQWNGTSWSSLGSGIDGGDFARIDALVVWDDGTGTALYAGGSFVGAGGVTCNSIARWNGSSWASLGSGVLGGYAPVMSMAVYDDGSGEALYAAGLFDTAGGNAANHIARWNGSSWSALGSGISLSSNPFDTEVTSLEVFDDGAGAKLYACGRFDVAGGTSVNNIASWNGTAWSDVAGGFASRVNALETFDDGTGLALYACGPFTVGSSDGIARWNGSSWSGVGVGIPGSLSCEVTALHAFDDGSGPALYAGGWFHPLACTSLFDSVARWNGATWSSVGQGIGHGGVLTFASFDDGSGPQLVAGGNFSGADGQANKSIASWGGSHWGSFGDGKGVLKYVRAMTATLTAPEGGTALYAAGFFTGIPGAECNGIARWNGTNWSTLGLGMDNGISSLVMFDDGSGLALYAGGYFITADGISAKHVAKWNGTNWSSLGVGLNAAVHALCVFDDGSGPALYAGGHFAGNVARWDGSTWTVVGGGMNSDVYDLTVFDNGSGPALYAGGEFNVAGSVSAIRVARWDGSAWSALGAGFGGPFGVVRALAVFDDGSGPALYAAGKSTYRVERWDGANWNAVGGGLDQEAHAMAVLDDGSGPALYVGGDFATAGGVSAKRVAKWNGVAWSALGGGVDGRVNSLGAFPRGSFAVCDIFVGGELEHAGDLPSAYVARWTNPCACTPTSYCTSGTSSFGCNAMISGVGTPSASASSSFSLQLSGVDGQRISYFYYGVNGAMAAPWGPSTSVLCVAAPRQRMGNQFTAGTAGACDGFLTRDWNAFLASKPNAIGQPFSVGQQVFAQAWYRDPPSPKSTGLSNALRFTVCP